MEPSSRRMVPVPDVVGLPFHIGRDLAAEFRVHLAGLDPDGPPIGATAWPGLFYIESQDPGPGSLILEHDSVRVTVSSHGASSESVARQPPNPPPHLKDRVVPEPAQRTIDLAGQQQVPDSI
jgi:hypothetical protein